MRGVIFCTSHKSESRLSLALITTIDADEWVCQLLTMLSSVLCKL